jgi:hypothetical protein
VLIINYDFCQMLQTGNTSVNNFVVRNVSGGGAGTCCTRGGKAVGIIYFGSMQISNTVVSKIYGKTSSHPLPCGKYFCY